MIYNNRNYHNDLKLIKNMADFASLQAGYQARFNELD